MGDSDDIVMLDLASSAMESNELHIQVDDVVGEIPLKVRDVNVHLMCTVCRGYLIDATTVTECLHSFCRSCIVPHVEKQHTCPLCQVALSRTKPFSQLRRDHTLQSIVYKMAPNLARSELQRRREFRRRRGPKSADVSSTDDRFLQSFFAASDPISLSLEYAHPNCGFGNNWFVRNRLVKKAESSNDESTGRRYYQCPSALPLGHLMKFLRCKYDVNDPAYKVEILYNGHPLSPEFKLSDVAYIFSWTEKEPLKLWFRFARADQAEEEAVPVSNPYAFPRNADEESVDPSPCSLKKWRRVLKKCANKKRTAKIPSPAKESGNSAPEKKVEESPVKDAEEKSPVKNEANGSAAEIATPAEDSGAGAKLPPDEKSGDQDGEKAAKRSPTPELRASSPKIESGKSSRSESIPAEESALSDWDSNSGSELVIDISTPSGNADEDETCEKKSAEKVGVEENVAESTSETSSHPPEEDKSLKNWLPKAVFDLDDRDLLAKRLQRETAGIADAKSPKVEEKGVEEAVVQVAEAYPTPEEPVAVSSPLSVKVPADECTRTGIDSPDVHDSIGALDLSGRSSDSSTDSPVPEASSPAKGTSPNGKMCTSPSGRSYGPHPYFLTPSAIYSSLGLLQPSLIPATTAPSASVTEPIKSAAPIRAESNGSDLKRKALGESQRQVKKPKRGLWDLFGIPTSTSSAGIVNSTLTELNSVRQRFGSCGRMMMPHPPPTHPT